MNKDYTHVAMIIDRSGSMASCWTDVQGGYKEIIKTNKATDGKCTFTVAAFDTEYTLLEDFTDVQAVKETLDVRPRGGTALLDAIGKTIENVVERIINIKKKERPAKVLVIVQTDGQENASNEYTKDSIKKLISKQIEKFDWQFQFVGASLESVQEAKHYGFMDCNTAVYNASNSLNTFTLLGKKMKAARCADLETYAKTMAFSSEDREILNETTK